MKNEFSKRLLKRTFACIGVMVVLLVTSVVMILNNPFLALFIQLLVILSPVIFSIHFIRKRKKEENKCKVIIRNQFNDEVNYMVESYHPEDEWGFLALGHSSLFFVPKKGDIEQFSLKDLGTYGAKAVGTGEYVTTTSQVAGGINISGTREAKIPVFYIVKNGNKYHWQSPHNSKLFDRMEEQLGGRSKKDKQVNF